MRDSYLNVYHGPIRGGKTGSMTVDASIDMLEGRRVFSNYPIEFDYQEDSESPIKHYASEELFADELLYIDHPDVKRKYTDCVIVWDEGALSMPAREFSTAQNKLTSQATLLRGKMEANLYFTVQYLSMWEKNMRIQEDNLIFCHDLSFKFRHLTRGSMISQAFQDISGRTTGETYEESQMVYRQTLHFQPFWHIYDTKKTFSVVRNKIKYGDVRLTLQNLKKDDSYQLRQEEENRVLIEHTIKEFESMGQEIIPPPVLFNVLRKRGFQGDRTEIGEVLMSMGVKLYGGRSWDIRPLLAEVA